MKPKVLLCGPDVTQDNELLEALRKKARVSLLQNVDELATTVKERHIALIVFELTQAWENELIVMHALKTSFSQLLILVINRGDDREVVIKSFRSGASDFFKKPYQPKLLVERIEALLSKM